VQLHYADRLVAIESEKASREHGIQSRVSLGSRQPSLKFLLRQVLALFRPSYLSHPGHQIRMVGKTVNKNHGIQWYLEQPLGHEVGHLPLFGSVIPSYL
jgi:hypothetical protein